MRILGVGATGTLGQPLVSALGGRHDLVLASRSRAHERIDISDPSSIRALYQRVGRVDAVVSAAGEARFAPLTQLSDEDFAFGLGSKLMGQVNLVRHGVDSVADGGSFTLTSGMLALAPAATRYRCVRAQYPRASPGARHQFIPEGRGTDARSAP